jgi:hypothetical protein
MTKTQELKLDLFAVARAYCDARGGTKLSSLGQMAIGRSAYFAKLQAGESRMVAEVYDQITQYMSDTWPADSAVKWPPHVTRPAPKERA